MGQMATKQPLNLLVTADDRTGALEIGGAVANEAFAVSVGVELQDSLCSVIDLDTRHKSPSTAYETVFELGKTPGVHRCHKMDSGLRGNWPHEVRALLDLNFRVGIIPGYPAAGRRCRDGVVYIDDVPLLESPFAADPFNAPCSNRPIEVLEQARVPQANVVLFDADTEPQVLRDVRTCYAEGRVLVSPTGPIGHYAKLLYPKSEPKTITPIGPMLIVCGSLNATSRAQIDQLDLPIYDLNESIPIESPITLASTPWTTQQLTQAAGEAMATKTAARIREVAHAFQTILIIGGATLATYLGNQTIRVLGTVATGIPIAEHGNHLLITKGGGIGHPATLRELCETLA